SLGRRLPHPTTSGAWRRDPLEPPTAPVYWRAISCRTGARRPSAARKIPTPCCCRSCKRLPDRLPPAPEPADERPCAPAPAARRRRRLPGLRGGLRVAAHGHGRRTRPRGSPRRAGGAGGAAPVRREPHGVARSEERRVGEESAVRG